MLIGSQSSYKATRSLSGRHARVRNAYHDPVVALVPPAWYRGHQDTPSSGISEEKVLRRLRRGNK